MKRAIQLLAALLALQVLLALAFNYGSADLAAPAANTPLLAAEADKIDRISIEGADQAKVELHKAEGKWQLSGTDAVADQDKVKQLIDKLKAIKLGTPVATSAGALERFKVAENGFERRIRLDSGGKTLTTLYLGSTKGRQMHARRADQKEVYAVTLTEYDAPVNAESWKAKTGQ